jgi:hypothetical protein
VRLLLVLLLLASPLDAQSFVLVSATDSVRQFLSDRWDDSRDPNQVERAFCATFIFVQGRNSEPFVVLTGIDSAETSAATARSVNYQCPRGTIPIHSHPASSPGSSGYTWGGLDANVCGPSARDLQSLRDTKALIGAIQCDRMALVGFSLYSLWPKP